MQPIAQAETEQAHHGLIRQSLPSHRRRMIRGHCPEQLVTLDAASVVDAGGIEPPTCRLRVECSAS